MPVFAQFLFHIMLCTGQVYMAHVTTASPIEPCEGIQTEIQLPALIEVVALLSGKGAAAGKLRLLRPEKFR